MIDWGCELWSTVQENMCCSWVLPSLTSPISEIPLAELRTVAAQLLSTDASTWLFTRWRGTFGWPSRYEGTRKERKGKSCCSTILAGARLEKSLFDTSTSNSHTESKNYLQWIDSWSISFFLLATWEASVWGICSSAAGESFGPNPG